jgi:hypothetical protein
MLQCFNSPPPPQHERGIFQHHWFPFALRNALPYGMSSKLSFDNTSSRRNFLRARLTPILTESTTLVSPKNPWRPPRPRDLFSDPWSCVHLPYSCGSGMICFGSDSGSGSDQDVSAPTPDPDPVSDPATLVSASRGLRGKLALYSWNYDDL